MAVAHLAVVVAVVLVVQVDVHLVMDAIHVVVVHPVQETVILTVVEDAIRVVWRRLL